MRSSYLPLNYVDVYAYAYLRISLSYILLMHMFKLLLVSNSALQ